MHDEEGLEQRLAAFRHEAANPVALIAAALHALQRREVAGDEAEQLLASAVRQTEVLQRLLDQLRAVRGDDLLLDISRLDLAELAEEVVADLRASLLSGRDCELDTPDDAVHVDGDPTMLRQVVTNLLDNAVKYTPEDTTIHVTVDRVDDEAELAVTDQGHGIAPTDLTRIFRRFERADEATEGLGLGLHLVWHIVQQHGGRVRAESAPSGTGARFVVRLPVPDESS